MREGAGEGGRQRAWESKGGSEEERERRREGTSKEEVKQGDGASE